MPESESEAEKFYTFREIAELVDERNVGRNFGSEHEAWNDKERTRIGILFLILDEIREMNEQLMRKGQAERKLAQHVACRYLFRRSKPDMDRWASEYDRIVEMLGGVDSKAARIACRSADELRVFWSEEYMLHWAKAYPPHFQGRLQLLVDSTKILRKVKTPSDIDQLTGIGPVLKNRILEAMEEGDSK